MAPKSVLSWASLKTNRTFPDFRKTFTAWASIAGFIDPWLIDSTLASLTHSHLRVIKIRISGGDTHLKPYTPIA